MNAPQRSADCDVSEVRLRALDGCELAATLYAPPGVAAPAQIAVLHCGAGIAQMRYRHFACFVARCGIALLTYDYRGVGRSRLASLRGYPATIEDWGQYDCSAAIAWLRERYPRSEMVGIAHSIGALLQGAAHNACEQARIVMIGAHTGYWGDYRGRHRLTMTLMWHGIMPIVTRLLGYFPACRLGLGDDLPGGVALQWAARRTSDLRPRGEGAEQDRTRQLLDRCATLERPVRMISISDDAFATEASAQRLLSYYPRLVLQRHLVIRPEEAGVRHLGHFGPFRRRAGAALWPRIVAELGPQPA